MFFTIKGSNSTSVSGQSKKKLENKASLGKAAQGKAAKGKAAIGKATKGQEDKKIVKNSFLRLVEDLAAWDDFSWDEYYWEEFYKKDVNLIDNHRDTHINFKKNYPYKLLTYSIYGFAWAFKASTS
nr:hypothetical protein [Tanacetum cinerariifolium]